MSGIYLIASFPKSSNTWLRAFIDSVRENGESPVNINQLSVINLGSRALLEDASGIDPSDLLPMERFHLRQQVLRRLSWDDATHYFKTHELASDPVTGQLNFPGDAIRGVLYLVRNPLDVVVSLAEHNNVTLDRAIEQMGGGGISVGGDEAQWDSQVPQYYGSWSSHVRSWTSISDFPVFVVTYESLLRDPINQFTRVAQFLQLEASEARIEQAVARCDFRRLREQEATFGFRECHHSGQTFFRYGREGVWKAHLSENQYQAVVGEHHGFMHEFGYV